MKFGKEELNEAKKIPIGTKVSYRGKSGVVISHSREEAANLGWRGALAPKITVHKVKLKNGKEITDTADQFDLEEDFNEKELKKGTDREMEHTDSRKEAAKIAKDHLKEKPDYYTKLDKCIPESKQEKTHIVIGNRGRGSQTLWPKSESPELYSQSEAEAIAAKLNGKPGIKFGPNQIHWHTKHIDLAHKFVNYGQPAWKGLSKLKDLEDLEEETLDQTNKYQEKDMKMNKKEDIQELSKKTLGNYIKKATKSAVNSTYKAGLSQDVDWSDYEKHSADSKKRQRGIAKATDKLVKEGVNGEHGPDEDEDQLDRIERKKMERSKKAAAKVKAIKQAQAKK